LLTRTGSRRGVAYEDRKEQSSCLQEQEGEQLLQTRQKGGQLFVTKTGGRIAVVTKDRSL
jgi:hypothetical protein